MFTIRVCSAMAATYLSVGISAVLLSVNSFGDVIPDGPYGVALLLVTGSTLLTGILLIFRSRSTEFVVLKH